jgi:hypothetical protein
MGWKSTGDCKVSSGEVHHVTAEAGELRDFGSLGDCSVTVMMRTALFPFSRSRLRNTTPSPADVFQSLVLSFREALASERFVLPTYTQVMAERPT